MANKDKYKLVETMELFGKVYEVKSKKNGLILFKDTPIYIKNNIVFTLRGEVPLPFAESGKPRIQKVRVVKEEVKTEEQMNTEELIKMFGGD